MAGSKLLFFLCITLVLFSTFSGQVVAKESNCTSDCHTDIGNDLHINPTSEKNCSTCHKEILTPHPQKNSQTFSTSNTECLNCHEQVVDHEMLHAPVAAADCSACHNPHNNKENNYIKETGALICSSCHPAVFSKDDTAFHGTLKQGNCLTCHAQHGSMYPLLLKGRYSTAYFNDYKSTHYEFCFKCHKIDLLLHSKTSYNTNFRDGKNNLHYLHVNRAQKGRACKFCHEIHSGTLPKLMAETVHFGEWEMPVNFVKTVNGGQCAPGCHAPATYQRNKR